MGASRHWSGGVSTEQKEVGSEAVVQQIAEVLSEPNVDLLRKVVRVIGAERAQAFLQTTLELEADGGLTVRDESRRRTAGGVFFYTVRKNISVRERKLIWPWSGEKKAPAAPKAKTQGNPPEAPPSPPPAILTWGQARAIGIKLLAATKGKTTVKLTVIGRPKQVGKAQSCIVCVMEDRGAPASIPKGMPTPPANAKQTVAVFIAEKHWRKVEASLKENQEDELIIDGWPYFDPAKQMTVLLAQGVTTKLIQRGQREKQSSFRGG
jgi:hypothetical protein